MLIVPRKVNTILPEGRKLNALLCLGSSSQELVDNRVYNVNTQNLLSRESAKSNPDEIRHSGYVPLSSDSNINVNDNEHIIEYKYKAMTIQEAQRAENEMIREAEEAQERSLREIRGTSNLKACDSTYGQGSSCENSVSNSLPWIENNRNRRKECKQETGKFEKEVFMGTTDNRVPWLETYGSNETSPLTCKRKLADVSVCRLNGNVRTKIVGKVSKSSAHQVLSENSFSKTTTGYKNRTNPTSDIPQLYPSGTNFTNASWKELTPGSNMNTKTGRKNEASSLSLNNDQNSKLPELLYGGCVVRKKLEPYQKPDDFSDIRSERLNKLLREMPLLYPKGNNYISQFVDISNHSDRKKKENDNGMPIHDPKFQSDNDLGYSGWKSFDSSKTSSLYAREPLPSINQKMIGTILVQLGQSGYEWRPVYCGPNKLHKPYYLTSTGNRIFVLDKSRIINDLKCRT